MSQESEHVPALTAQSVPWISTKAAMQQPIPLANSQSRCSMCNRGASRAWHNTQAVQPEKEQNRNGLYWILCGLARSTKRREHQLNSPNIKIRFPSSRDREFESWWCHRYSPLGVQERKSGLALCMGGASAKNVKEQHLIVTKRWPWRLQYCVVFLKWFQISPC